MYVHVLPFYNICSLTSISKYLYVLMKQKISHKLFYKNIVFWISRVYLLEILTFSRMCSFLKCTCIPHKRKTFWQLILPSVEIQTFLLIKNWPSFFQGPLNAPLEKKISWENKRRIWGKNFCNCLLKLCRRNFRFFRKKKKKKIPTWENYLIESLSVFVKGLSNFYH